VYGIITCLYKNGTLLITGDIYTCTSHIKFLYKIEGVLIESWPGSSIDIATDYELDGPGSNPGGNEIFRPCKPALGPTEPPVKWVPGLSRG